jgi:phosphopantothenoylcysteine decarboxylase/phosphopantothenate--cysteine ligase
MLPTHQFKNKHILVGITGGIAAYKSCELVRYLVNQEAEVRIVMTKAAEKFITPLTLETLSTHPVSIEMFPEKDFSSTHHIHLADWAEAVIIAPASYNFIGKLYSGIADDLLSTMAAAVHCPMVIAPAMNVHMWNHSILQRNLRELEKLGYLVCPPEEGFLAEGYSGKGRLAPLEHLIQYLYKAIHSKPKSLKGKTVLVTAGRTEEPIDLVRVLSNKSSGKMGFALAWEAFARGARVILICGPTQLALPVDIETIQVITAEQMYKAIKNRIKETDLYISAAAISDFTPEKLLGFKLKKREMGKTLQLKLTVDILKKVAEQRRKDQILIGFAVETDQPEKYAKQKLTEKNLDLIVVNNPKEAGAGFDTDTNIVTLFHKNGSSEKIPQMPKLDVAYRIFQFIEKHS